MEATELKPLIWLGSSRSKLKQFPEPVRDEIGYALFRAQRIRIDCVSGANHDLILWLDKPGMLISRLIYKQIYCFECKVLEVRIGRVLFFGRAIAFAYKEAMQNMKL